MSAQLREDHPHLDASELEQALNGGQDDRALGILRRHLGEGTYVRKVKQLLDADISDVPGLSAFLREHVDARRHRFFPGNHDHHDELPPHCLGDYGDVNLGGVRFFFARGAASMDKEKLLRVGRQLGKRVWDPREELD